MKTMEQDINYNINFNGVREESSSNFDRRDAGLVLVESDGMSKDEKISPDKSLSLISDETKDRDDNDIYYQYMDHNGTALSINSAVPSLKSVRRVASSTKTWTKPMVRSLIQCYREYMDEFRDPSIKQKDVWMKAASLMRRIGYNLTWSECDRKWRNLKHTFKTFYYKKHENKRVSWEFYDDLFTLFVPSAEDANKQKHRKSRVLFPPDLDSSDVSAGLIPKREMESSDTPPPFETAPRWFTDYMKDFEKRQWMYVEEIRRIHEISLEAERQRHKAMEVLVSMIQRDLQK